MAQKIRRRKRTKLEPPLPETKDELNLPKYFGMIHGGGLGRAEEESRRETIPELMAKPKEVPKTIPSRRSLSQITQLPNPKPELARMPWIVRITRRFKSILKIEPEREMMAGLPPKTKEVPKTIVTKTPEKRETSLQDQRSEPEKVPAIIKRSRQFKSNLEVEPEGEVVHGLPPKTKEVPKTIVTKASGERETGLQDQRSEPEKVPAVIKRSRQFKAGLNVEPEREVVSGLRPKTKEVPKLVRTDESKEPVDNFPNSKPESERMPLILRMAKRIVSALKVEPERPVRMPVVPELSFPPLYTRYPMMRTVTKTTDGNGKITVTFDHLFMEVPGVVLTVKGTDAYSANVTDVTLTNFEAIFFKAAHAHGGTVIDGGVHTPTINADGQHAHQVTGSIGWTENSNYGRLVLANYTDYEKDHTHKAHTSPSHNYTGYENVHTHSFGAWTGVPDVDYSAVYDDYNEGSACTSGVCILSMVATDVPSTTHYHYVSGTTGAGSLHRHLMGKTGPVDNVDGHRHLISNDALYDHYMTSITNVSLALLVTANENPHHAHTGGEIVAHDHGVAEDGDALLTNTQVTITYLAQVES